MVASGLEVGARRVIHGRRTTLVCEELTLSEFMAARAQGSESPKIANRPLTKLNTRVNGRLGTELKVSTLGFFFSFSLSTSIFFECHLNLILGVRALKLE